jgi:hypothetical protein
VTMRSMNIHTGEGFETDVDATTPFCDNDRSGTDDIGYEVESTEAFKGFEDLYCANIEHGSLIIEVDDDALSKALGQLQGGVILEGHAIHDFMDDEVVTRIFRVAFTHDTDASAFMLKHGGALKQV